jgi:hypothetical protein
LKIGDGIIIIIIIIGVRKNIWEQKKTQRFCDEDEDNISSSSSSSLE